MIEDAPALGGGLPNGGPAGEALRLAQGVGEEESIGTEAAQAVIGALPASGSRVDGRPLLQKRMEDEVSTVAPARCANLPIIGCCGSFEVDQRGAEFRGVKDGFAAAEFFKNREQLTVDVGKDDVMAPCSDCRIDLAPPVVEPFGSAFRILKKCSNAIAGRG